MSLPLGRPVRRHGPSSSAGLLRSLRSHAQALCTLRSFVLCVGATLIVANLALLLLLQGSDSASDASQLEDHPTGEPLPRADMLTAQVSRALRNEGIGGGGEPLAPPGAFKHNGLTPPNAAQTPEQQAAQKANALELMQKAAEAARVAERKDREEKQRQKRLKLLPEQTALLQAQQRLHLDREEAAARDGGGGGGLLPFGLPLPSRAGGPHAELVKSASTRSFSADVLDQTEYSLVVVDFFAPWCNACKTFAPLFRKAAQQMRAQGDSVRFVGVDAVRNEALAQAYNIKNFPTVKVFRRGEMGAEPEHYTGPKTTEALVSFLKNTLNESPGAKILRQQRERIAREGEEAGLALEQMEAARKLIPRNPPPAAPKPQYDARSMVPSRSSAAPTTPGWTPTPAGGGGAVSPSSAAFSSEAASARASLWQRPPRNGPAQACDEQFGNGFVPSNSFCAAGEGAEASDGSSWATSSSSLSCSRNSRVGSVVCFGRNIAVDLTRMDVSPGGEPIESVRGRSEEAEFVRYASGAFRARCDPSDRGNPTGVAASFPHHLKDMFTAFQFDSPSSQQGEGGEDECDSWVSEPALFLTRYEYANLYHSMGDFYNSFQAQWMHPLAASLFGPDPSGQVGKLHVIFFDGHSAGALDEVWTRVWDRGVVSYVRGLASSFPPSRGGRAPTGRVCFRHAIFVPPAYKSALSVDMMTAGDSVGSGACGENDFVRDFVNFFVEKYGSDRVDPRAVFPPGSAQAVDLFGREIFPSGVDLDRTPLILFLFRRDYLAHPRLQSLQASRKVANEAEVGNLLARAGEWNPPAHAVGVDFAALSFGAQLLLVRSASLLVGLHGAGLSFSLFLRPGASVLELIPGEYASRPHFRFFSQWAGREYGSMGVGGDQAHRGHTVEVGELERQLGRGIAKGNVGATEGWKASRGLALPAPPAPSSPAPATEQSIFSPNTPTSPSAGPRGAPPSRILAPGESWTSGMQDDPLPSSFDPLSSPPDPRLQPLVSPEPDSTKGPSGNDGHRLCIVVPFRDSASATSQGANRTENLLELIPFLIRHLEKNGGGMRFVRDFEFIVVEQTEGVVFNKGALFNVGFLHSQGAGCDYMVLHDVDQLPLSPNNKYRFPVRGPVHICSASSQYGFQMAYGTMVGGALLLNMHHYARVNGYSNFYWLKYMHAHSAGAVERGWGQEDDDFYYRLSGVLGEVARLSAEDGRYQALTHPRVRDLDVTPIFTQGTKHLTDTRTGALDIQTDGLSNLRYRVRAIERWAERWPQGVRKIVAELAFDNMPTGLTDVRPARRR